MTTTTTAPRPVRRAVRLLLAAAVLLSAALGGLLAGAAPAAAHAVLLASDPADGAVVATAPAEVTLTFSEKIAVGDDSIRVLEPSGKRADTDEIRELGTDGGVVYGVTLHPGLPDGTYTVAWQGVSADSHPVAGAFTFSIGAPSQTTVALPDQEAGGGLVGTLYDLARYAAYAGFTVLAGGGAFVLLCWPRGAAERPVRRLVVRGWITATAATLVMLLLRAPYTGGGGLADVLDLAALGDVLDTKTGAALVSRLLLLGAAALFVAVLFGAYARMPAAGADAAEGPAQDGPGTGTRRDLTFGLAMGGGVLAAGIAATWALSEHASTGIQPGVAMPVDVLHLLAVAAWLGGLATLLTALYRTPSIEREAVRRFSTVAFASVAVLAATGLYQSWRQVGSWSALTGTRYGQLLLVKLALVALLVAVAWFSRRWTRQLTDPEPGTGTGTEGTGTGAPGKGTGTGGSAGVAAAGDGADPARARRAAQLERQRAVVADAARKRARDADAERSGLRRSVLVEAGVAAVLLAVTTALTSTEPGRAQEAAAASGVQAAPAAPAGPTEVELPFDTGGEGGEGTVRLTLGPARAGSNEMHVWAVTPGGKPLDAPELKVSFTLKAKEIGPLPITPDRVSAGHWSAGSVQIPMPGDWQIKVTVRTSDIDQTTVDETIEIG
ncbi:copper resistance protein CopC [Streptomyces sp. C10-9-1]|uniref:copper resistance CopC/CopD family protein n=1 Tax=Streptomyces sp. C10-9-1 TaxID=1859285 RepID=UPI002113286C|nr:copper resistance protein CopC [Streptomyces sp. C10-9-1]MCQ6555932.1 copper resistance protein CopC [Streptomyces sp. C10-9-1]